MQGLALVVVLIILAVALLVGPSELKHNAKPYVMHNATHNATPYAMQCATHTIRCGRPAGASPVPLGGNRIWGPVGGIEIAMARNPLMKPADSFLSGDPRSADTSRENLR